MVRGDAELDVDEINRRTAEVRREKERAGEARHAPHVVAAVLRRVAARPREGASAVSVASSNHGVPARS